ncbi:glioma pathogenesis-related protein 1 [Biomphalaria glabrata]|nr:glioma pathogenesis-related protein 1 [Biomphalaria glabrata]
MTSNQQLMLCFCCLILSVSADFLHLDHLAVHTDQGVIAVHPQRRLTKREVNNQNVAGFTPEEKSAILQLHNTLRAKESSSNMIRMSWNSDLEKLAQDYSGKCVFEHSTKQYRGDVGGFNYIGENLYAITGSFNVTSPVQMWWDEFKYYNFNTMYCEPSQMCGHYTQVVWAESYALGCGVKYCPVLKGTNFPRGGYNVVCHYGPGGNYQGEQPYKKGRACSECPEDLKFCVNQLCALRPVIGSSSTSYHSSLGQHVLLVFVIIYTCVKHFVTR